MGRPHFAHRDGSNEKGDPMAFAPERIHMCSASVAKEATAALQKTIGN